VRFGIAVPSYGPAAHADVGGAGLRSLLLAIEDLGYDGVWFPDHVAVPSSAGHLTPPFLEPLAMCAWAVGTTSRLRVGTDVLVAPYRNPLVVAAMAATIATTAGAGRFVLGVGVGYVRDEFAALGVPYDDRGTRTDDTVTAIRNAWARTDPRVVAPPEPGVPIWIGGNGPPAQRRAAALGDGWHPIACTPEEYAAGRRRIVAARAEAGRDGPFTFSYSCGGNDPSTSDHIQALATAGVEHMTLRFGADLDRIQRFARDVLLRFA
jgi:alkanesulfonate monooxygenase SsuD/methylene tetrahydromethanopterin reductase-like flavin-dependent oxidoreductase (luciferase family)